MNFRQRISWLLVVLYLAGTGACVYYIFEISDMFNVYALDHVNKFHKPAAVVLEGRQDQQALGVTEAADKTESIFVHVTDIPLAVWMIICLIPYLQIFAMLMACTKPNPQFSMAYMWPIYSYMWFQQKLNRSATSDMLPTDNKSSKNGSVIVIDK